MFAGSQVVSIHTNPHSCHYIVVFVLVEQQLVDDVGASGETHQIEFIFVERVMDVIEDIFSIMVVARMPEVIILNRRSKSIGIDNGSVVTLLSDCCDKLLNIFSF